MEQKKDGTIELTEKQMAKISGGDPGNLLFSGKAAPKVKPVVQKGTTPKAGSLVNKEVKASGKKKTITEKDGIDGILLSGGGGPKLC